MLYKNKLFHSKSEVKIPSSIIWWGQGMLACGVHFQTVLRLGVVFQVTLDQHIEPEIHYLHSAGPSTLYHSVGMG